MKNIANSVRVRLFNYSKQSKIPFQNLLDDFAISRFLWRLSRSRFSENYVLKGAQLFRLWSGSAHRPTRDLDLLGKGAPDEETLRTNFTEVLALECMPPDGLEWFAVETGLIRKELKYGGVRAMLRGALDGARVAVQIDVGFGDAISPAPRSEAWTGLIGFPAAELLAYPPETVIAEKLEAAVVLDIRNSRMKDFFDLDWLSRHMEFDYAILRDAVHKTFSRRGTAWPEETPLALSVAFGADASKQIQWSAFLRKNKLYADPLPEVIQRLHAFLNPVLFSGNGHAPRHWKFLCGWQPKD